MVFSIVQFQDRNRTGLRESYRMASWLHPGCCIQDQQVNLQRISRTRTGQLYQQDIPAIIFVNYITLFRLLWLFPVRITQGVDFYYLVPITCD